MNCKITLFQPFYKIIQTKTALSLTNQHFFTFTLLPNSCRTTGDASATARRLVGRAT